MSALEAFDSTWAGARATLGEGVPQRGDEFDNSGRLRQLQATVESAAPGDKWQGAAAAAYSARNQRCAAVYGALADLDRRMATDVTNAAAVVDAGRRNLETTQNWVRSMAAAIPPGQSAETMRMILARKGVSDVRVNALSHELGHALNNPPLDRSSKDAFVNSRLDGEGAATMNTIKIEREILAAGGPDIIPAEPNDDRFEQIYDAYLQAGSTPEAYQSAIRQIGEVYGTLIPSTDPNTTYREYYGRDYK